MSGIIPANTNGWGTAFGAVGAKSNINAVLDVREHAPLYAYTEPVTLESVKLYGKIDYDEEDELISELITVAREELEKYLGVSMVPKIFTVQLRNDCGGIEIPYGPTPDDIDITTILGYDGLPVNPTWISIKGEQFKQINAPQEWLQLTYNAGYGDEIPLPAALKMAIRAYVFFLFTNRGEYLGESSGVRQYAASYVADAALSISKKYSRNFDAIGF